jgi:hypothetical protein
MKGRTRTGECRRCGCTETRPCEDARAASACSWTHLVDVCSACLTKTEYRAFLNYLFGGKKHTRPSRVMSTRKAAAGNMFRGTPGRGTFSEKGGGTMKPYLSIPVEVARQIARDFDKQIVIISAWNHEHKKLHITTYGSEPNDKISAARGGEICAKALGMDLARFEPHEDFRTLSAAKNAQLRDLADGLICALRSYQHGNSAPDLAQEYADRIEAIIKPA